MRWPCVLLTSGHNVKPLMMALGRAANELLLARALDHVPVIGATRLGPVKNPTLGVGHDHGPTSWGLDDGHVTGWLNARMAMPLW